MAFADNLRPASWRGVPFALEASNGRYGRRKVEHDYPYRDTVWLEDQGKLPRRFSILGFLISNSAKYGGGDVNGQIRRMEEAAEATGVGVLVHPTRGRLTVDLIDLQIRERAEEGGYAEVEFSFVQGGAQVFPAVLAALGDLVSKAAGLADAAGLGDFVSKVSGPLLQGLGAGEAMAATAAGWIGQADSLARDATSLYGTVSQLGGADYGRYFNGRNAGFLSGLVSPFAGASSVGDLISTGAELRQKVGSAADLVTAAIGSLGVGTSLSDVAGAVQGHVAALQASAADPADGIRILSGLTGFTPSGSPAATAAGSSLSALYRRAATVAMARVSATYAPSSADDAAATRAAVVGPLDAEARIAGNSGADEVFAALRGLRQAVVNDLGERGGALARLTQIELPTQIPAVVIANLRYGDANRGAELVTQADPVHPWFMPNLITALAD